MAAEGFGNELLSIDRLIERLSDRGFLQTRSLRIQKDGICVGPLEIEDFCFGGGTHQFHRVEAHFINHVDIGPQ